MTFDEYLNKLDPMTGFCLADVWSPAELAAARQAWDAKDVDAAQTEAYAEGRADQLAETVAVQEAPMGLRLVPLQATAEMERAADTYAIQTAHRPKGFWWWGRLYEAMLNAAPLPVAPKAEPSVRDDLLFHGCNDAVADMIAGAVEQADSAVAPKAEPDSDEKGFPSAEAEIPVSDVMQPVVADTLTDDKLERMALAAGAFAVPKQGRMSTVHWFQKGVRAGYALANRAIPAEQATPPGVANLLSLTDKYAEAEAELREHEQAGTLLVEEKERARDAAKNALMDAMAAALKSHAPE